MLRRTSTKILALEYLRSLAKENIEIMVFSSIFRHLFQIYKKYLNDRLENSDKT